MRFVRLTLIALTIVFAIAGSITGAQARGGFGGGGGFAGRGANPDHGVEWGRGGKPAYALPGHADKGGAERGLVRGGALAGPHGANGRFNALTHGTGGH